MYSRSGTTGNSIFHCRKTNACLGTTIEFGISVLKKKKWSFECCCKVFISLERMVWPFG